MNKAAAGGCGQDPRQARPHRGLSRAGKLPRSLPVLAPVEHQLAGSLLDSALALVILWLDGVTKFEDGISDSTAGPVCRLISSAAREGPFSGLLASAFWRTPPQGGTEGGASRRRPVGTGGLLLPGIEITPGAGTASRTVTSTLPETSVA